MKEWKAKKLKSQGRKVKNRRQAIAIALSEARRTCGNRSVTRKRSSRKRRTSRKRQH